MTENGQPAETPKTCATCLWWLSLRNSEWGICQRVFGTEHSMKLSYSTGARLDTRPEHFCSEWEPKP